jgi:hypothetical protein
MVNSIGVVVATVMILAAPDASRAEIILSMVEELGTGFGFSTADRKKRIRRYSYV